MKQICLGVDIIEIQRIRQALTIWDERFLKRIFTPKEIEIYKNSPESLAVRFAGKEAVFKALSRPGLSISWQDVEILSGEAGKPFIKLFGELEKRAAEMEIQNLEISLSHSRDNAIAIVVGLT
jgi:holo-[acyl-carrier protein] synthase